MGSGAHRPVCVTRAPWCRGHGPGVPGQVHSGPAGGRKDDQDRVRRGGRVPGPVRARGGCGAPRQRSVHGRRRGGRRRCRRAVAGHRVHPGAFADRAGTDLRPAAGAGHPVAGRRVCRGAGVDPYRRAGAPRSQAVQRAGLAGRPAGDRLRGGQGRRADPAHGDPRRRWHARLHGAGTGTRHPPGVGRQRHVLAWRDPALRGHRARPLPGRDRDGRAGPARHRAAGSGRPARGADRSGHLLPGTQPQEAAHLRRPAQPARAVRRRARGAERAPRLPDRPGDGAHRRLPAGPAARGPCPGGRRERGPKAGPPRRPPSGRAPRCPHRAGRCCAAG